MGSKQVFGVLILIVGVILAYLFVTGNLQNVWAIITTGQLPASSTTPTTGANTAYSNDAGAANTSTASFGSYSGPVSSAAPTSQMSSSAVSSSVPSSAGVQVSNLASVYSPTLASQTGVTGAIT